LNVLPTLAVVAVCVGFGLAVCCAWCDAGGLDWTWAVVFPLHAARAPPVASVAAAMDSAAVVFLCVLVLAQRPVRGAKARALPERARDVVLPGRVSRMLWD
jgi:hypothetical protein